MAWVEAVDGAVVTLAVGADARLRLAENASTGYRWSAELDADTVAIEDRWRAPSATAGPGAAGERWIRLRALAPGTATLTLRLSRPWEPVAAEERRLTVRVTAPRGAPDPAGGAGRADP